MSIDAIEAMYNGRDTFLLLPTGLRKSICYECLPFLYDYKLGNTEPSQGATVLVVSPLISLMINQVESLRHRGVSAAILSGSSGTVERDMQATSLKPGQYSLVYTAPEALLDNQKWRQSMLDFSACNKVVAVAVDEAHCVSRWSMNFRKLYGRVGEVRAIVPPGTPWLACTATATHVVRDDICKKLDMIGCKVVSISPDRPNIYYGSI